MRIGLIGSGNIGSTVARLAVAAGHEVIVSNSRGRGTLSDLVVSLGDAATAGTAEQAAADGDVVVVSIPVKAYRDVPAAPLAGKVVIDAGNYYPQRDGQILELEDGSSTSSELLAGSLGAARVVKAFNSIMARDLDRQGQPAGTPDRRAIAIAGDDAEAKATVAQLLDAFGFDTVDAGSLAEGRRFQPGTRAYITRLSADELRRALAAE
jgi:8-hydroxy-5-deazaflavin:NADPH oxidoreductase